MSNELIGFQNNAIITWSASLRELIMDQLAKHAPTSTVSYGFSVEEIDESLFAKRQKSLRQATCLYIVGGRETLLKTQSTETRLKRETAGNHLENRQIT